MPLDFGPIFASGLPAWHDPDGRKRAQELLDEIFTLGGHQAEKIGTKKLLGSVVGKLGLIGSTALDQLQPFGRAANTIEARQESQLEHDSQLRYEELRRHNERKRIQLLWLLKQIAEQQTIPGMSLGAFPSWLTDPC